MNKLAIIIPAFKAKFLKCSLESIASQTNQNFKLYVSDDGSNEDLNSIVKNFETKINLEYYRFDVNIGAQNLVKHWNRSIALAKEEWVWLFSDDDIMPSTCVNSFHEALEKHNLKTNLFRFNIEIIDINNKIICSKQKHPEFQEPLNFLINRLESKVLSAGVEYIFKKDIFNKNNGFVDFPLAFCSDDASWILFSDQLPICTINTENILWRSSGINISSKRGLQYNKIIAYLAFMNWINEYFTTQKILLKPKYEKWFFESLKYVNGRISFVTSVIIGYKLSKIINKNFFYCIFKLNLR